MEGISWGSIAGIIVDMILISTLVATVYEGHKKGLVGVVFSIVSFIAAIIITFILYKPVSQMVIDRTDWDEKLTVTIEKNLTDVMIDDEGNLVTDPNSNISDSIINFINKIIKESTDGIKTKTITFAAEKLSIFMVRVGTMIALYIICSIVLLFAKSVIEVIADFPFIRLINESGGIIYGVIKGFVIIYVILGIASLLSPLISQWGIISAIQKAYFGSRLYNNNILLNFILRK